MKKRKNSQDKPAYPVTRAREAGFSSFPSPGAPGDLYYLLRREIPIIDAAITKLCRLVGGFEIKCSSKEATAFCKWINENVEVNGNANGVEAFLSVYFEQLLTLGTAVGEIITDCGGMPCGLYNSQISNLLFKRSDNGFDTELYVLDIEGERPVKAKEKILMSVLNPLPGCITGVSILEGLGFMGKILHKIYETIGENWERAGALRYAVTYKPANNPTDTALAAERASQIASAWEKSMTGGGISDFITVGDVDISVIGKDGPVLNSEVPVRQILEQIIAKTGLPPYLLGLSWSSTERMSQGQTDILTTELWHYRRLLTPVINKIFTYFLRKNGFTDSFEIVWDEISIIDS